MSKTVDTVIDQNITQKIEIHEGDTHVVIPTNVLTLTSVSIRSKNEIPKFCVKVTAPFDYNLPRAMRVGVTNYDKRNEYCSELSGIESYEESEYYKKLMLNHQTMEPLWKLLQEIKLMNPLLNCDIDNYDRKYIYQNVLSMVPYDYSTLVFEEAVKDDQILIIEYIGKNVKREVFGINGFLESSEMVIDGRK